MSVLHTAHAQKLSFTHLDQHGLSRRQAELMIDTRATFVVHLDPALLDQTPRFAHRSGQAGFDRLLIQQANFEASTVIANQFREVENDMHRAALIYVGLLLLIITLIVNAIARVLVWRVTKGQVVTVIE